MEKYSNVPDELKALKQWVGFKLIPKEDGKMNKIPINPKNGQGAKANDPSTWSDFQTAIDSVQHFGADGIGIEFANGIFGIDLDHVIDEQGELTDEAKEIVETMDSYTEYSPSHTGLHIICRGTIPDGAKRKGNVEMYSTARYFTVTGEVLGKLRPLEERTSQAKIIHEKYLQKKEQKPPEMNWNSTISCETRASETSISDREIIEKACTTPNGAKFEALWRGDTSAYGGDDSKADLALMSHLAYWTNGDRQRMDSLFRQSGLMRTKWDEKRGADTYGEMTISKALGGFTPYIPNNPQKKTASSAGTLETVSSNTSEGKATQQVYHEEEIKSIVPQPDLVSTYLDTEFMADLEKFKSFKGRKTGFSKLDSLCRNLYPGLYVMGATSSLGKTTFIQQVGDNLAEAGEHVIFFGFEQDRFILTTKSLSRIMAKRDMRTAIEAIDIQGGNILSESFALAVEEYNSRIAGRMNIVNCNFETNFDWIRTYVEDYIKNNGVTPIVIVDYLQMIPPNDPRHNAKETVDYNIKGLKKMQVDYNLVLFVISSINRANYLTPMDFESFKESGGIEYTADVIWGLQLQVLHENAFEDLTKIPYKREVIRKKRNDNPRKLELMCLKNRFGISSYYCGFNYNPRFDLFEVDDHYVRGLENTIGAIPRKPENKPALEIKQISQRTPKPRRKLD